MVPSATASRAGGISAVMPIASQPGNLFDCVFSCRSAVRVGPVGTTSTATPSTIPRRLADLLHVAAPLLLILSVAIRFVSEHVVRAEDLLIDLHVYVGGAAALDHPGTLYSYNYASPVPGLPLPFTYPPFAAVVFYPLHLLPFGLVAFVWRAGTIAALYGAIRISQRLVGVPSGSGQRVAMLWTAIGIWVDPVRHTLDDGQVNVFLMLAVLWAVYSTRWWFSGLLVGVAAGVKLTPAITDVYFVGVRRWGAAVFSAVVLLVTIAVSALADGGQTRYYFLELLGEARRIGPVGTALNQSWRAGISRILGYDAGFGPLVLAALAATATLAVLAWRALDTGRIAGATESDRLGKLLVVELLGLLVSPISWTHHWVWLVPLMIWLIHGPLCEHLGARILGWGWLVLMLLRVPMALALLQPSFWQIGRPWYLAWAGLVYVASTIVTFTWIVISGRKTASNDHPLPARGCYSKAPASEAEPPSPGDPDSQNVVG